MTRTDLLPLANHLWQSTLCVGVVWVLSLALKRNRAAVRFWLWLAASIKFLLPFSLLVGIGNRLEWRSVPVAGQIPWSTVMDDITGPFAITPSFPHDTTPAADPIPTILVIIWFCGFAISVAFWLRCWRSARAVRRRAIPLALDLPIPVMSCPGSLEPGVFGIYHPVLLLPEGIADRLAPAQLDAILSHEMCHVRRRDNLTGAIHLIVETIFWFHPLIWWIRARLVEERERACDEAVLQSGREPRIYAEGIINVCKLYMEAPSVCVAGVTGSHLGKRIEAIMTSRFGYELDWRKKALLVCVAISAAAGPIAMGLVNARPMQAQSQAGPPMSFEVASVKANVAGGERAPRMILPGGRFTATNNTVRDLILNAYGVTIPSLLEGGPGWIDSARYDIDAKAGANAIPAGATGRVLWEKTRLMLQTLLADRFKLSIRRQTKEAPVYELVVARNGAKLQKSDRDCTESATACHGFSGNPTHLSGSAVDMYDLALTLTGYSDRPVIDRTGIQGLFDLKLQWNPFIGRPQIADDSPRSPAAQAREGPRPDLA